MKELQYPVRPGRYRHFKGNEYQVLGVARHSGDRGGDGGVPRPVRRGRAVGAPAGHVNGNGSRDGVTKPRFTYIGE